MSTRPNSSSIDAVAYHEAGHAVISMRLGYRCLYVTIVPDGVFRGKVAAGIAAERKLDDVSAGILLLMRY